MGKIARVADDVTINDNAAEHRFEMRVDGALAGFADYHDRGTHRRVFTHTEIDPAYEGHGLGSRLVRFVLDDARSRGLDVIPVCPFVRSWLESHPDYVDLVPADERGQFGLGGGATPG
jgi:predicted GNAT family acetyltransferase